MRNSTRCSTQLTATRRHASPGRWHLLANESQQRSSGFSTRLRAFGARHIDGIWLDRLTLGANVESVSVSGSTLSPDSVPRYLRSLAQDPALKGGQIDEFIIEKPTTDKDGKPFRAAA